ncbi:MAG TPA: hypothetical protein VGM88_16815 [Kofleriaceae bacterium]|jgi:hypothetical protein
MTKESDALDAVLHEAALVETESGKATPGEAKIAKAAREHVMAQVAAARRALVPAAAAPVKAKPLKPGLLALTRDALLAKLEAALAGGRALGYAHRDLAGLTDDDLRRLVQTIEDDGEA